MSLCPFCKATTPSSHGACPKCGKVASDHPSVAATAGRTLSNDFDDDLDGDLHLEEGSAVGSGAHAAPDTYGSGSLDLDDELMGEGAPPGDLELDLPPGAPAVRSGAPPGSVPDLEIKPSQPKISAAPARARPSGQQAAVSAPPSSGRGVPSAAPSSGRGLPSAAPSSSGRLPPPAPISSGSLPAVSSPPSDPQIEAPPPEPSKPNPAALVAKYPPPPAVVWQAPVYACKVLWRQFELRQDLESLRRKRSPDVPLYEAALGTYEKKSFTVGLALTIAALSLATFIFFLPVIIRFIRAPD